MKLISRSFRPNGPIPGRCAFAVRAPKGHVRLADNRNPHLAWTAVPEGTRSFVLTCIDADAPTRPDDVNREGRIVPTELPRAEFVHWLMVDIPPGVREIAEGSCSDGVAPRGRTDPAGPPGSRQGINDYTGWFKGDAAMDGVYRGYDGPCPPWNDARVHHYRFEILATDLEHCPVGDAFTLADLGKALAGHILDRASITGRYSLNPRIRLR
ncbi:YbhB/YbcL family Raf kinase inhibitor-like protein [Fontimonas sp. SYSU GA230001]|uniref:YbhB/YbcL family Raf kinase inhibitor-like protein n=1 Tax=Fontimonas sp. SYSU GA230001 TaxID=3142450 RepID=UPI0032B38855